MAWARRGTAGRMQDVAPRIPTSRPLTWTQIEYFDSRGAKIIETVPKNPADVYLPSYTPKHPGAFQAFQNVDRDRSGTIRWEELQTALSIGIRSETFRDSLCRGLIRIFDSDQNGTLEFHEFSVLFALLTDWIACFQAIQQAPEDNGVTGHGMRLGKAHTSAVKKALLENRAGAGTALPAEMIDYIVSTLDVDSQERVSFTEYMRMLVQMESCKRFIANFTAGNVAQGTLPNFTQRDLLLAIFCARCWPGL